MRAIVDVWVPRTAVMSGSDAHAAVSARVCELRDRGYSTHQIAAVLTAEGYRTERGNVCHGTTVWRLLRQLDDAPRVN